MPSAFNPAAPFVGLILDFLTLPQHWRSRNLAMLSMIGWLSTYNLIYAINAVIWEGNVDVRVPVWCDIATKIKIGADVAVPVCFMCIAKRLNRIASGVETQQRVSDLWLCLGLPFLTMGLHIIVQGHRFDILENIGCIPAVYTSWLSMFILELSGLIPAIVALVFCGLTLFKLYRRRVAFRTTLSTQSFLTPSRFIRLMITTLFLGTWNSLLISVVIYKEYYETGLEPWTSWAQVHFHFSYIGQYPLSEKFFSPATFIYTYVLWAAIPFSSLCVFLLFGLGNEAMKDYRTSVDWIRQNILRRPAAHEFRCGVVPQSNGDRSKFKILTTDAKQYDEKPLPPTPVTPFVILYPHAAVVDLAA
ncbi:fungal pheromone STE3G-protein-coupled receptor [Favolaschia claudopus]|uniref:Fungal pheromone STE3G-protein-coupled receptor n=1 Tax=Favolaschia claudopus TaxID=2862362 RepID=A0AAW0CBI7_9AGAR